MGSRSGGRNDTAGNASGDAAGEQARPQAGPPCLSEIGGGPHSSDEQTQPFSSETHALTLLKKQQPLLEETHPGNAPVSHSQKPQHQEKQGLIVSGIVATGLEPDRRDPGFAQDIGDILHLSYGSLFYKRKQPASFLYSKVCDVSF